MKEDIITEHNQQVTDKNGKEYTVTVQTMYDVMSSDDEAMLYCFGTDEGYLRKSQYSYKHPSEVMIACRFDYWFIDQGKLVKDLKKHILPLQKDQQLPTRGQQAYDIARKQIGMFRNWLHNHWYFVGVRAVLLNSDGTESSIQHSVWGISSEDTGIIQEYKEEMVKDVLHTINNNMAVTTIERYVEA